ncbi:2-hydroxy-3-oxopropionate reductase [termite gut metagenome]|uniref:2-hydroxy-3-oxopropionate reductase n=1 Tax=termite gut metagenome TaxID=433724 RepID=A0A5J4SHD7_9ZZZZ
MKIVLIGYGIIGSAWSKHYASDGHDLRIWNRTPKDTPYFVQDLNTAVSGAEVVHIVIADPPAIDSVLPTVIANLAPGALVIQSSTISPDASDKFLAQIIKVGGSYVEAPFTGSKIAAEQRENVFFIGGSEPDKVRAKKVLSALSKKTFDMGTNRQACTIKLAMNLQIALISQALNEGLEFSRSAGINDELFFQILNENVAHSGLSDLKKPKLLTNDFSPQFSVKHLHKDLRLALATAPAKLLPITAKVADIYSEGLRQNWGDEDFTSLIKLLQG